MQSAVPYMNKYYDSINCGFSLIEM